MDAEKIRVLVVEDDREFAYLIEDMLKCQTDFEFSGWAQDSRNAVGLALKTLPHVVLMDLNLSPTKMDGIDAAREIRLSSGAKVVILTMFERPEIILEASKRSFASGYVFKSQFSMLPEVIRATARGHTPQEWMILSMLLDELSPAERTVFDIMLGKKMELFSSQKTIANQKTNILRKLGLRSQKELLHIFDGVYSL